MKTAHKIRLARAAYGVVRAARAVCGRGDRCTVVRRGITWELDLAEGVDFAIYVRGAFERDSIAAYARVIKEGHVVLDIGANIGALTLELARIVGPSGRIVAFEPTEFAFTKLEHNIGLNPQLKDRIVALHCFLGDAPDQQVPDAIYSSWPLRAATALHEKHLGSANVTGGARVLRLDTVIADLGISRVDAIKLDVDGFECAVLEGARGVLSRDRPVMFVELAPYVHRERGYTFERFLGYFTALGYRIYDQRNEQPLTGSADAIEASIGDGASINAIARPM